MIFTSYFANIRKLPPNIFPVAITAVVPDWYTGLSYSLLAPSYDILRRYKRDRDEAAYTKLFSQSILDNLDLDTVLRDLNEMTPAHFRPIMISTIYKDPNWHVALICYEKSGDFCHRHLVADWFRCNGVECGEWQI